MNKKEVYVAPAIEIIPIREYTNLLATISASGSFDADDWGWEDEEI